jgi:hypothetical protein
MAHVCDPRYVKGISRWIMVRGHPGEKKFDLSEKIK